MVMSLINSLPEDIIIDCISRVPRRDYPTLSLVSKYSRSLIRSHELYARRVLLDRTEYCLYVTISESGSYPSNDRLYTLRHNFNSPDKNYSLVPVSTSLPLIPPRVSYVTVDSKIFVIPDDERLLSTHTSLLIDCRFHTAHHVPSTPNEVGSIGEISIGVHKVGTRMDISDGVVMFLKQIPKTLVSMHQWSYKSDHKLSLVTLKTNILNLKAWYDDKCFLDGVPFFHDPRFRELPAVDVREVSVEDVKVITLMTGEDVMKSRTVVYGEKVVVFLQIEICEKNEIWCVEIKVERDQKGELCGRVEWCGCVLEGQGHAGPDLKNSFVVKV